MAPSDPPERLKAEGWHVSPQAVHDVAEELDCSEEECYNTLADVDLKRVGLPCLPADVNSASSASISGPVVLQVQAIKDVSKSSISTGGSGAARLLMLKLTDGKVNAKAAEHKRIEALSDLLPPGTKIQVKGATVRMGVIMLEPKCVKVLGGRVEAMAEAHEFARRYANVERSKGGDNDMDRAPAFKAFVPGRDNAKGTARAKAPSAQPAALAGPAAPQPGQPSLTQQTLASATYALPGRGKDGQNEEETRRTPVDVEPAVFTVGSGPGQAKAGAKLQELLASHEAEKGGRGGRGGGRKGGRGRRGRQNEDDDDAGGGALTLEEYEAQKKAKLNSMLGGGNKAAEPPNAGPSLAAQEKADKAMAEKLQAQMDMEDQVAIAQRHVQQQQRQQQARGHKGQSRGGGRGQAEQQQYPQQQLHPQQQYPPQQQGRGRGRAGRGADGGRGGRWWQQDAQPAPAPPPPPFPPQQLQQQHPQRQQQQRPQSARPAPVQSNGPQPVPYQQQQPQPQRQAAPSPPPKAQQHSKPSRPQSTQPAPHFVPVAQPQPQQQPQQQQQQRPHSARPAPAHMRGPQSGQQQQQQSGMGVPPPPSPPPPRPMSAAQPTGGQTRVAQAAVAAALGGLGRGGRRGGRGGGGPAGQQAPSAAQGSR